MRIWLLLLACGGPPDPLRQSLDAYQEGLAHLEAGRTERAAAAFRAALEANPQAAEVQLWLGRALAAQGDLDGAIAAATEALEQRGAWGIAHYNRACWRARAGRLELAALDLSVALKDPDLDRLAIAADPDLDPLRADPRYRDRVPARALPAQVEAVGDPLFLGAIWSLHFTAQARPDEDLDLSLAPGAQALPAAARWIKTVEDRQRREDQELRSLEITFQVEGAAAGSAGPFHIESGGLAATVGPVAYTFLAPEGHIPPPSGISPDPLRSPEALLGAADTGALRRGEEVLIRAEPGDTIRVEPALPTVKLERRREGQPQWIGQLLISPEPVTVTITRGGTERFAQTL